MTDRNEAPVCGLDCGDCPFLGGMCRGCATEEGRPFWTKDLPSKVCPLHDCCRNRRQLEHCGLCPEFPCRVFLELRDPNLSDEEFDASLQDRKTALHRRAVVGTEQWLKEKRKKA